MTAPAPGAGRGSLVWVDLSPTTGCEQRGRRPAIVVASDGYLASVRGLTIVLPITSVDRSWPHHVRIRGRPTGLSRPSFAMTEQPRTISLDRVTGSAGRADATTLAEVDQWMRDFLAL